jgi:isopenicillin N synthase-like dioxygenase
MKSGNNTQPTAHQIRETCKNTGFFYVKNHGVPEDLQQSIMESAEQFFALPRE